MNYAVVWQHVMLPHHRCFCFHVRDFSDPRFDKLYPYSDKRYFIGNFNELFLNKFLWEKHISFYVVSLNFASFRKITAKLKEKLIY
jgi:hypothetical protein